MTSRLNSIHFLRFFAAAAVVLHHIITGYGSSVMVGAAGVDVFFVISGIVIGMALEREGALEFGLKRAIRIFPMYWLATVVYAVFRFSAWHLAPTDEDIARSVFMLPAGRDWLPIYYPGWTLIYEMLFYVIATFALAFFRVRARLVTLGIVAAVAAVFHLPLLMEFCAGVLISVAVMRGYASNRTLGAICVAVALALFARHLGMVSDDRTLVWGIPAALLVFGLLAFDGARLFENRWVVLGGNASYAIYLFHLPAIEWTGILMPSNHLVFGLLRFSVAIAAGVLIHVHIEKPVLSVLRKSLLQGKRLILT